ncbi:Dihydropteroate synthase [Devosia sp. DBB001]|nr:Dihydropteroate synthase [Devosia sp. DBB001]
MQGVLHQEYSVPLATGEVLRLGRHAVVMGILNVTPDSFSDGGDFAGLEAAVAHAHEMAAEGADIIDVGGESTRPGHDEVSVQDELDRVIPVMEALSACSLAPLISIDTYKALVADQAVQSGAAIINDVYGLQREPEIADVAALHNVPIIAMHWDKDRDPARPLIDEMLRYFDRTIEIAGKAGIGKDRLILDPGFGFGKNLQENYKLMQVFGRLHDLGLPILIGTSRKSMIGKLLGNEPKERLAGTLATTTLAYAGGAHIFRVHDVKANRDALRVAAASLYGPAHTEA